MLESERTEGYQDVTATLTTTTRETSNSVTAPPPSLERGSSPDLSLTVFRPYTPLQLVEDLGSDTPPAMPPNTRPPRAQRQSAAPRDAETERDEDEYKS